MVFALLTSAAIVTGAMAGPPLPVVLSGYVQLGRFDPGDYAWLRGAFPDATAAERAAYKPVTDWQVECFARRQAQVKRELAALGVRNAKVPPAPYGGGLCAAVSYYRAASRGRASFPAFARDVAVARPITGAFLFATRLAEEQGGPRGSTLADKLAARPMGEQILRIATSWGEGDAKDAPALAPGVREVVLAQLDAAIAERDHANTEWLKEIVARDGWPKRSIVGEHQANFAWLLVQHADLDPAFQLRALRLMEPLVPGGEVARPDYALLFDRVQLQIAGTQRYGTQMTCRAGTWTPLPLEDEAAVPRRRVEAGLPPMAEYVAQMRAMAGDCGGR